MATPHLEAEIERVKDLPRDQRLRGGAWEGVSEPYASRGAILAAWSSAGPRRREGSRMSRKQPIHQRGGRGRVGSGAGVRGRGRWSRAIRWIRRRVFRVKRLRRSNRCGKSPGPGRILRSRCSGYGWSREQAAGRLVRDGVRMVGGDRGRSRWLLRRWALRGLRGSQGSPGAGGPSRSRSLRFLRGLRVAKPAVEGANHPGSRRVLRPGRESRGRVGRLSSCPGPRRGSPG